MFRNHTLRIELLAQWLVHWRDEFVEGMTMQSHTPIRAVIFGVEGVLVRLADLSGLQRWGSRLGLSPRQLIADILESPSSARACVGLMTDADLWMELACLYYRLHADEVAALARDFWDIMQVDGELLAFVGSCRRRVRVAALANAWPGARQRYMHTFGIANSVDTLVLSCEEGLVMPDTRIYEVVAERLGISPEEALFVDASAERIAGARDAGLQVLPFIDHGQIANDLSRVLASFPNGIELAARAAS